MYRFIRLNLAGSQTDKHIHYNPRNVVCYGARSSVFSRSSYILETFVLKSPTQLTISRYKQPYNIRVRFIFRL